MRTLETIRRYNFAQKNHWQLMCDFSDNDYDIKYFDGRQTANIELEEFLQENDEFNIDKILNYLTDKYEEYTLMHLKFYRENNCYNEFYGGYVSETDLLAKIVKQNY